MGDLRGNRNDYRPTKLNPDKRMMSSRTAAPVAAAATMQGIFDPLQKGTGKNAVAAVPPTQHWQSGTR